MSRPPKITVREAIEQLQKFNPDHHILTAIGDEMETYASSIHQMGPGTVRITGAEGEEYMGQDDPDDDNEEENDKVSDNDKPEFTDPVEDDKRVGEPVGEPTNQAPWPRKITNVDLPDENLPADEQVRAFQDTASKLPTDAGTGTDAVDAATKIRRQRRQEELRQRQIAERHTLLAAHDAELRDAGFTEGDNNAVVTESVKSFAPVNININLDELMQYFGMEYDEDGPTGNPTRDIRHQIMGMAADQLVKQVMSGDAAFKGRLNDSINEALGDIIVDMLTKQFQPTDWSGQPKGDPTTLTEIIGVQATQFLAETMSEPGRYDDRSNNHKGTLRKFVNEEVGRQFQGELKVAADAAKATVVKAVTDKGAEFLGQAFADAAAKVQAGTAAMRAAGVVIGTT